MSTSFGLTSGFLCHFWYNFLDRALPGSGIRIVARKIIYDQLVFSPICITTCLATAGAVEGSKLRTIGRDLVEKGTCLFSRLFAKMKSQKNRLISGTQLYLAEWLLWPPAQFVNFYFLPTRYRVFFDNIVSLFYDVYTSDVKHHQPAKSKAIGDLS